MQQQDKVDQLDEARLSAYLKQHPDELHLILVTDAPHTYRTYYAFNKVFEANGLDYVRLEMAAAPNDVFDESNWYTTEKGLLYYIQETIKVLIYWLDMQNSSLVIPR